MTPNLSAPRLGVKALQGWRWLKPVAHLGPEHSWRLPCALPRLQPVLAPSKGHSKALKVKPEFIFSNPLYFELLFSRQTQRNKTRPFCSIIQPSEPAGTLETGSPSSSRCTCQLTATSAGTGRDGEAGALHGPSPQNTPHFHIHRPHRAGTVSCAWEQGQ